jgi:hypothetical protein
MIQFFWWILFIEGVFNNENNPISQVAIALPLSGVRAVSKVF